MVNRVEKPRLVGVLPVVEGRLVKSYRYSGRRPGIALSTALKALDDWEIDEVVVLDISRGKSGISKNVDVIQSTPISSPLSYGGGLRNREDVKVFHDAGVERFVFENLFRRDINEMVRIAEDIGPQAIIASLPFSEAKPFAAYPKALHSSKVVDTTLSLLSRGLCSEVMLISADSEGVAGSFPVDLASSFSELPVRSIIWFGGISPSQYGQLAGLEWTAGIGFGNILFESETPLRRIQMENQLADSGNVQS